MAMPKTNKITLTVTEKTVLQHPPLPDTWTCKGEFEKSNGEKEKCKMANRGKDANCWLCGNAKVDNVVLWPIYTEACKKVGIEAGWRWERRSSRKNYMRKPGGSWIEAPDVPNLA